MGEKSHQSVTYDVVVATRNRPDMLKFSIPSFLKQTRPPARLIVVDASDNHQAVADVVAACAQATPTDCQVTVLSTRPWQAAQRNQGIAHVSAPIVMVPDDDSIWLEDAAEQILRVYERDTEGVVGGVSMSETRVMPPELRTPEAEQVREATLTDRLIYRYAGIKARTLSRLAENPARIAGRQLLARHAKPPWLGEVQAHPISLMLGFRMTFRTAVVRANPFHEQLARGRGFDDHEVSLAVLKTHLLVEAERALVYHHRVGGTRDQGLETGITQLLNNAYIVCRHTEAGDPARRALGAYARRLLVDYVLRTHTRFGRDRFTGIWRASRCIPALLKASPEQLTECYQTAFEQCRTGGQVS